MKVTNEIDIIYDYVDDMMKKGEWNDLSRMFYGFLSQIETMPLNIMLAYIIASAPAGSKIQHRRQFINLCKEKHPYDPDEPQYDLWKGI